MASAFSSTDALPSSKLTNEWHFLLLPVSNFMQLDLGDLIQLFQNDNLQYISCVFPCSGFFCLEPRLANYS
jgi:hypothetical protein